MDDTGYVWLDVYSGEPPVTDANGRLLKPHTKTLVNDQQETWGVGTKLPRTPKAQDELNERVRAERERGARPAAAKDPEAPASRPKRGARRRAA